tara:strand:+ start:651 stop:914 length:264 start_codon:yes stop_codon:yes gene_type:complete
MKLSISFIILPLFVFSIACSNKIEPPDSVIINENIVAKKSYFDASLGCTIYLPHSKDGSFVKQIIYFVYYENKRFVVRGNSDSKNCL